MPVDSNGAAARMRVPSRYSSHSAGMPNTQRHATSSASSDGLRQHSASVRVEDLSLEDIFLEMQHA